MKKTTFLFVFSTYPVCFYSNFKWESLLDAEFNSTSNKYPHCILLTDPDTSSSRFFRYFLFLGSEVRQKYAVWVLVGCGIKFRIQRYFSIKIWVKPLGDMSKIWTQKVVFLIFSSKINKYYFIILTIVLLF